MVVECISSREMSENSIEFSLSIAERRAVGFILAWSLASLQAHKLRPRLFLTFVVNSLPLWNNSTLLWVTLLLLHIVLDSRELSVFRGNNRRYRLS